jgi:hypothetical protein
MPGDLLARMRANPAGNWRIRDVEARRMLMRGMLRRARF